MPQYFGGLTAAYRGKYYEATSAERVFAGGNQAAVATALPAGLTASYTGGLVLYNPIDSTVKVSINTAALALLSPQTNSASLGVGVGFSPTTAPTGTLTAVTPECMNVGSGATATAKLYSSASITLPVAPVLVKDLVTVAAGEGTSAVQDIGGEIVLEPGGYACFTSTAAGTASKFLGNFSWEEIAFGGTQ